ncbi:hypothetical protein [Mobiluncus mulieris]|uniref:Lipoprotein n=1 Tax=Mobiluncus mulieris TaxID=2052 RepID=A0A7Y0YIU7_9ACTO|nr:hypothetical protein [Mobiluncus mulieris]NMX04184.1 hypothetical protein [Mobiluncus mulieris]NMX12409.1 hypothetical protein [Mobiluncus mulieris]
MKLKILSIITLFLGLTILISCEATSHHGSSADNSGLPYLKICEGFNCDKYYADKEHSAWEVKTDSIPTKPIKWIPFPVKSSKPVKLYLDDGIKADRIDFFYFLDNYQKNGEPLDSEPITVCSSTDTQPNCSRLLKNNYYSLNIPEIISRQGGHFSISAICYSDNPDLIYIPVWHFNFTVKDEINTAH